MKGDITNNLKVLEYPQIDQTEDTVNGLIKESKIISLINDHRAFIEKFTENKNFFIGKNIDIKQNIDANNPDNEINIPSARTLTRTIKGYMYKPGNINYSLEDETNQENFDLLLDVFKKNNEPTENAELGEHQSKYGIAFELLYLSLVEEKSIPRFTCIDPCEIIPLFDYTIEKKLIGAIRYYTILQEKNREKKQVEIYYPNITYYYIYEQEVDTRGNTKITLTENKPATTNGFKDVPLIIYKNNKEYLADYESVKTLIVLLDKLISDSANELDRFAAAYIIMKNYVLGGNAQESREKLAKLKSLRVFEIGEDGDIKFLTKDIPVEFFKEIKDSIKQLVIDHSGIPDFNDQSFGTASGIAIKYKLINLENLCADKESYFKDGLERRIKLIDNFMKIQTPESSLDNIKITFTRNLPDNLTEAIDNFKKIDPDGGLLSKDTSLSLLPFIKNPDDEIAKIDEEKEKRKEEMPDVNLDALPNTQNTDTNINVNSTDATNGIMNE